MKKLLFLIVIIAAAGYLIYEYTPIVNSNAISIKILKPKKYISNNSTIDIYVKDRYPIKKVSIGIKTLNVGTNLSLMKKYFENRDVYVLKLHFKPNKVIPTNGKAILYVLVADYSHSNFMNGFTKTASRALVVSTSPPNVYLLSGVDYTTAGGSALAIFYAKGKLPIEKAYVIVNYGKNKSAIFKAYDAYSIFHNKHIYMTFFTFPYSQIHNWNAYAVAIDRAGNKTTIHIPVYYTVYRSTHPRIHVSEKLIKTKVITILKRERVKLKKNLLEDFLYTMTHIFPENLKQIREICQNSINKLLWEKYPFTQLFHSVVESKFFVRRKWVYDGRVVFETPFYHPGYDLASVDHAMVNASNSGRIVYEGYLGVFGKSLIIDHGFGLFTFYGHLSDYLLPVGSRVKRNQYVAISGSTGLAFGDHVDFSTLIDGYFVNPLDWWSKEWIKYNVFNKIREAKLRFTLYSMG